MARIGVDVRGEDGLLDIELNIPHREVVVVYSEDDVRKEIGNVEPNGRPEASLIIPDALDLIAELGGLSGPLSPVDHDEVTISRGHVKRGGHLSWLRVL